MMTTPQNISPDKKERAADAPASYSRARSFYDRLAWGCTTGKIIAFNNEHISARHLDISGGNGNLLDKCVLPSPEPLIALAGPNAGNLKRAAQRLQDYNPTIQVINPLKPFWIRPGSFESIGMTALLHTLPGDLRSKSVVFQHIKPLLSRSGGVVFGTTILGKGVIHNPLGRALMLINNARGVFGNHWDTPWDLEAALKTHFHTYELHIEGSVALFSGKI